MEPGKPLRGAIACPACGCLFRGRYFSRSGERGYYRRCPNGHEFKNPPKPVKVKPCPSCSALREEVERLREAVEWAIKVVEETASMLTDKDQVYRDNKSAWLMMAAELRRRVEGK